MKLLILGGTQFVGRHIVECALARGHEVTLFHRGKTNPGLFAEAEEILGDRDGGLEPLRGRRWDAVLDVNGYVPRIVRDSARLLRDAVDRYVYISTLSVLADLTVPNQDESTPRVRFEHVFTEEITKDTYGPLKAACEAILEGEMPGHAAVLRPGFIVGPWDHTGRFNYWLRRHADGGEMLVPGTKESPMQFIDARDLAAFTNHVAESGKTGTYHCVGPREPLTWHGFFQECGRVTGIDTPVTFVSEAFLQERNVGPGELPMWFPGAEGLARTNNCKAVAEGLTFRPVSETIRDTMAWDEVHGRRDVGMKPERERELLTAWIEAKQAV